MLAGLIVMAAGVALALTPQTVPREPANGESPRPDAATKAPVPDPAPSHVPVTSGDGIDRGLAAARAHAAAIEQAVTAGPGRTGPGLVDAEIAQTADRAQKLERELATPGVRK